MKKRKYIIKTVVIRKIGRKWRYFVLKPMSEYDMIKLGIKKEHET